MPPEPPLGDLRVVEFLGLGPVPFACTLLADLGADVLAVARPGLSRPALAENRPVLELDLKSDEGRRQARRLAGSADILVEGFRHDINYIAVTGALHHATRRGPGAVAGVPTPTANLLGDFGAGGMYLVAAVLAAVQRQEIAAAVRTRTRAEWAAAAAGTDACLTPVLSLAEAAEHPHVLAREVLRPAPGGQPGHRPGLPLGGFARPGPAWDVLDRWGVAAPVAT